MSTPNSPPLGHAAITVGDPHDVASFYRDPLDLQTVRQANSPLTGDAVPLSGDPAQEDHELVLCRNPEARHVGFRVSSVHQLRSLYTIAKHRGLDIPYTLDSSVAVGFFLRDPEENALEIYLARSRPGRDRPPLTDSEEIDPLIRGRKGGLP